MIDKIEAIIFDMDGVLIDSEPHHMKIEKRLFEKYHLRVSDEEHRSYMGMASHEMWAKINESHGAKINVPEAIALNYQECKSYFSSLEKTTPMPGLHPLLTVLKNNDVPMAVASSAGVETIDIILEKTGLTHFFGVVVSGTQVENSKPAPDIFLHTARLLQKAPEHCLVVEDSINGVRAAKAAGMFCVAYAGTATSPAQHPEADIRISHFDELDTLLKKHEILRK